ncbi:MAG: hypothetical protein JW739_07285 [Opitutales bacterium]|nr:hypothetical protein [Opitutales bacterium]
MNLHSVVENIDYYIPHFQISNEAKLLGLHGCILLIRNILNCTDHTAVHSYVQKTVHEVLSSITRETINGHPYLLGYRELHTSIGKSNKKFIASSENLLSYVLKKQNLPSINAIVDLYNAVSIKYMLSMGGHDMDKIEGGMHLRISKGKEMFNGLGSEVPIELPQGEYGYFDQSGDVLCRMDVKQSIKTLIDLKTSNCLLVLQGNAAMPWEHVVEAANEISAQIRAHFFTTNIDRIDF